MHGLITVMQVAYSSEQTALERPDLPSQLASVLIIFIITA